MEFKYILIVFVLFSKSDCDDTLNKKRFPKDFMFGVSTSAYQIEGAWNEDGKGESNWDHFVHQVPNPILNNDTGDVACDSYHKIKEDVALLKYLGVDHYRFSISWSRLLPTGYSKKINMAAVKYYKNLIRELQDYNIEPIVTLLHFDTPQVFEDMGGWTNEFIIQRYLEYAEICFEKFGADVKYWITFNEAMLMCVQGYGVGVTPPGKKSSGIGEYMCAHNVIKAHAKVYRKYYEVYQPVQKGEVGMTLVSAWNEPLSDSDEDKEAAERMMLFTFGWFAHPIIFGNYPYQMVNLIGERSYLQGFSQSRLPSFTDEEKKFITGTADFFGLNYYTAMLIQDLGEFKDLDVSWTADTEVIQSQDPSWPNTTVELFKVYPDGMYKFVKWVTDTYKKIHILITENGYPDVGTLEDDDRISYTQQHLSKLRDAMDEGANVIGYTHWSFLDNFEWNSGYAVKFGLIDVDFNSPDRTRTPKKSAEYIKQVYATNCIMQDPSECYDSKAEL